MAEHQDGKLVVMVAPSGSGKTTMARRLLTDIAELRFSVSATTRTPREGEVDGQEYYFISNEEFDRRVAEGEFLEWESFYNGTRYGTLKPEVDFLLKKGYFVLLDLEVHGAQNVKNMYGDRCLSVFIEPPSLSVLEMRLRSRGSETEQSIATRLERAAYEMSFRDRFDIRVVNDDLEHAYAQIYSVVREFLKS
jgi:guanylate kinase